jgi:hypothetical protein
MDNNTKNLLKNPASGGIPAMENKIKVKVAARREFRIPKDVQFIKYLGIFVMELVA